MVTEQTDSAKSTGDADNEIVAIAKGSVDKHKFKTGVAVGIGSAAIVAALMYARSGRARKK